MPTTKNFWSALFHNDCDSSIPSSKPQDETTDHTEKALAYFKSGYNCSQSVSRAFCDLVQVDKDLLLRLTEGFGSGMGCMEGPCGAISGAICIASLLAAQETDHRAKSYAMSRQIVQRFREKNQTVICRELKGLGNGVLLRDCYGCVADATTILTQVLLEHDYLHDQAVGFRQHTKN